MKKTIRLTESDLHRVIRESIKRVINETELNYDVDNFSGRHYKNPPEEIDPTDYLDDPNNPPGSGEDWADWDDFVEDEFGGDQKAAENAYSWGLHDNSGFLPDGNKGRMAYGYDADSMIDRNNDSIDDEERVKTAMGQHEKKKWLNGAKDDEMFDFLHPGVYGESKLRNIVRESIKRVINEEWYPENENDIDDYYYGAIFKFGTDLVYFDEGENIPEDLLDIKEEYIDSENTYVSVMVTNVEPEMDETDGSASFAITAAISAPNMPLDDIEEEVINTVWVWLENKLNKRFTRVWIEGEKVVYDRRSIE